MCKLCYRVPLKDGTLKMAICHLFVAVHCPKTRTQGWHMADFKVPSLGWSLYVDWVLCLNYAFTASGDCNGCFIRSETTIKHEWHEDQPKQTYKPTW